MAGLGGVMKALMNEMQKALYQKAKTFRDAHLVKADTWEQFRGAITGSNGVSNFVLAHWDGTTETEKRIQEETKATIRCIPLDGEPESGTCIRTGKSSTRRVIFAQSDPALLHYAKLHHSRHSLPLRPVLHLLQAGAKSLGQQPCDGPRQRGFRLVHARPKRPQDRPHRAQPSASRARVPTVVRDVSRWGNFA